MTQKHRDIIEEKDTKPKINLQLIIYDAKRKFVYYYTNWSLSIICIDIIKLIFKVHNTAYADEYNPKS